MARSRTPTTDSTPAQLDVLCARYPGLAPLRALAGPDGRITPEFLEAYIRSDVPGVVRERLLMAALGDPAERSEPPLLTPEIAEGTLLFLEHHPSRPLSPWSGRFKREDIPQRLRRMYAPQAEQRSTGTDLRPRLDAFEFVRRALLQPAVETVLPRPVPRAGGRERRHPSRVAHLQRLLTAFVLSPEDARRLLREPRARHAFTHYFHTGQPVLDLRNALQFYLALLERTDFEASAIGKSSHRIDLGLLGLPKRGSHPLIALTTQLIALGVLGLIEPGRGPWTDPHLGGVLRTLLDSPTSFETDSIARGHLNHWILDSSSIDRWHAALSGQGPNARYTLSILFDPQFAIDKVSHVERREALSGHYACVDTSALRTYLHAHYADRDPDFAEHLASWFERVPEMFSGLRTRALANALYYARFLEERGEEPRVVLPQSAKVALGAERSPGGGGRLLRPVDSRRRVPRQQAARRMELPVLDQLSTPGVLERRIARSTRPAKPPRPRAAAPRRASSPPSVTEIGEVLGRLRTSGSSTRTVRRKR
jgi:hypothetical protein